MLPPFIGLLACTSSRHSTTDAALEWHVLEKQGDEILNRSGLCCRRYRDAFRSESEFIVIGDDDSVESTQRTVYDYNAPKNARSSSDYRDDPLGGDPWTNNSSPVQVVSEFSKEFPRPDYPTISLCDHPGIVRKHHIETGPPQEDDRPLSDTTFSNIQMGRSDDCKGRYSGSDRTGGPAAKLRVHGDQPRVRMPSGPYSMLGPNWDHQHQQLAHAQDRFEPSLVKSSEDDFHQNIDDQYYQSQEMALDDASRFQSATIGCSYRAGNFPNLDLLSDNEISECEASHPSNPRPGQDPLQSSQSVSEDTICAPRLSAEPVHDRIRDLVEDGPKVLPLHDQFGAHHPALDFSALEPYVYTGQPDGLNFPGCSTGGLGWPSLENNGMSSRFRSMRSRISSRLRGLWPE